MKKMTGEEKVDLYIIVADDDPDDHEIVKKAVSDCRANYLVSSVYNGQQLLDLLEGKEFYKTRSFKIPDMIVLDLKMPVMDGFEVLDKIKKDKRFLSIPIHVLSDSPDDPDKDRAIELGATSFHTKPLRYGELLNIMKKICEKTTDAK